MATKAQQAKATAKANDSTPTTGNGADNTPTATPVFDMELEYKTWKTTVSALGWPANVAIPPKVAYLIGNGFTQSMTDAAAFSADQKAKILEKYREDNKLAKDAKLDDATQKVAWDAAAVAARQKKYDAILAGTIGTTGPRGPRLDAFEKMVHTIALERITAQFKKKDKPMVTGDVLKALVLSVVEKQGESIRKEATARMVRAAAESDDIGDLIDMALTPKVTPTPDANPTPDATPDAPQA